MKKLLNKSVIAIILILVVFNLTGCSKSKDNNTELIQVGVCAGPYGDLFQDAIAPTLIAQGYKIEVIEFSDIVTPNTALDEGEIDVNVFQHSIYLDNFNNEKNTKLTYVTEIPTAGMGIFSENIKNVADIPIDAVFAIPNDVTNTARALRVLAQTGAITLDENVNQATVTATDIIDNPKDITVKELNPEILPTVLESVDGAIINGYFAIAAGLDLADALYNEVVKGGYVNVIAISEANKDSQFAKDIYAAVHSDAFRTAIENPEKQYKSFTKPDTYYEDAK